MSTIRVEKSSKVFYLFDRLYLNRKLHQSSSGECLFLKSGQAVDRPARPIPTPLQRRPKKFFELNLKVGIYTKYMTQHYRQ